MTEKRLAEVSSPAMPQLEWRCFHCDEVFTDALEATQHFGSEEFKTPACRMSSDDVKRLRDLEDENAALRHENDRLDNDARLWHESEADRVRRIGNVQWWQEMDSREGEKLVLQEQLAVARAASPAASPFEVSEDARAHIAGVARRLRVIGDRDTPEGRGLQNLAGILTEALKGAASPATPALDVFQRIFHVANLALGEPPATRMADTGALVEIAMLAEQALKAQR